MNKKLKFAGLLALILFALGGVATWDEWKTKKDQELDAAKNKIVSFKADEVTDLEYHSEVDTTVPTSEDPAKTESVKPVDAVISKVEGVWRLKSPVDAVADAGTVDNLIKTVTDYSFAKVVSEEKSRWADFGLANPKRAIKLKASAKSPVEWTLFIGDKAPVGYEVYFRTSESDKVYIGSQHILVSTTKSMVEFRDKTIVKVDESKLKSIRYQRRGEPEIVLSREGGNYSIVSPEPLQADGVAVREFIEDLGNLRAADFVDAPDEGLKAALTMPEASVILGTDSPAPTEIRFLEFGGKTFVAIDQNPTLYMLAENAKANYKHDLMDFRNRRILEADMVNAKSIEIDGQSYKNIAGNWYAASDAEKFDDKGVLKADVKDKPTELPYIRAFVVDLEFAKTDKFIPSSAPEAKNLGSAPLHHITLGYQDSKKPALSIDVFKFDSDNANYLVRRSGSDVIYHVPVSVFASMTAPSAGASPATTPDMPMDDDNGADLGGEAPGLGEIASPG